MRSNINLAFTATRAAHEIMIEDAHTKLMQATQGDNSYGAVIEAAEELVAISKYTAQDVLKILQTRFRNIAEDAREAQMLRQGWGAAAGERAQEAHDTLKPVERELATIAIDLAA